MTPQRWKTLQRVVLDRSRYLTVVLEEIYQPHNASAVLRTCDCLGIQDVYIIEERNKYTLNPDVELGAAQWLTLHRYNDPDGNNLEKAVHNLRTKGYRIVATTPHTDDTELFDFNLSAGPVALFFGTELKGLSKEMIHAADEYLRIPMYGFTESYNISVSAAIILSHLAKELHLSDLPWRLTQTEQQKLLLAWIRKSVKSADLLEQKFNQQMSEGSD